MYDIIEIGKLRQDMALLFRRAATDKEFRALCLKDSSRAYLELTSRVMPEQYSVDFFETEKEIHKNDANRRVRLPKYYSNAWF